MKYDFPFYNHQIEHIIEKFPNAKMLEKKENYQWIEIEINDKYGILDLFHAGIKCGLNQTLTNKNQQL